MLPFLMSEMIRASPGFLLAVERRENTTTAQNLSMPDTHERFQSKNENSYLNPAYARGRRSERILSH